MDQGWTVGELAEIAGVTVRTLHHYDEIDLLVPSGRSAAGYRLYSRAELERLQEILLYRDAGLPLEEIRASLDDPAADRVRSLRAHREALVARRSHLKRLIRTVDRTIEAIEEESPMSGTEMFEGFEELENAPNEVRSHHRKHAREAHKRWGESPEFAESGRRTRSCSPDQWEELRREVDTAEARMAELLRRGADPAGPEAMDGAEGLRIHIDRWFYPCSTRVHATLAEMYTADPRFRAHYEERAEGLAEFVAAAIRANAGRTG